jgi:hypothetical protein
MVRVIRSARSASKQANLHRSAPVFLDVDVSQDRSGIWTVENPRPTEQDRHKSVPAASGEPADRSLWRTLLDMSFRPMILYFKGTVKIGASDGCGRLIHPWLASGRILNLSPVLPRPLSCVHHTQETTSHLTRYPFSTTIRGQDVFCLGSRQGTPRSVRAASRIGQNRRAVREPRRGGVPGWQAGERPFCLPRRDRGPKLLSRLGKDPSPGARVDAIWYLVMTRKGQRGDHATNESE